ERKKLFLFFLFVFLSQFFLPRTLNEVTPFMWSLRTDAIALGVMIAIFSNGRDMSVIFPKALAYKLISFSVLMVLVFALALLSSPKPFVSFSIGLTAVVSGLLVFIASYNRGLFSNDVFFRSVCDYIGSRSYSIYLTHVVGLSLTRIILGFDLNVISTFETILNCLFFAAITFVMAELSYRFVEMPLRKRGRI
ncbi:TPA: acyltransferase family protein, partial [Aeromonas hydrophila]